MSHYALAVTVHDPDGRWLRRLHPALGTIAVLYGVKAAACTATTSGRTVAALREAGFDVDRAPEGSLVGPNRRLALRSALGGGDTGWVHYADLDRLLHWQGTYPEELRALLAAPPDGHYIALGRTERAWQTHPPVQILAEQLTNAASVAAFDLNPPADFTAGSAICSRLAAEMLVRLSTEPANGTDLEWPALVVRELNVLPLTRATEGLEFETADYFAEEIERAGSRDAWVREVYSSPDVWLRRTQIARDSIAALARVLGAQGE